jgi:hypothetical protein
VAHREADRERTHVVVETNNIAGAAASRAELPPDFRRPRSAFVREIIETLLLTFFIFWLVNGWSAATASTATA